MPFAIFLALPLIVFGGFLYATLQDFERSLDALGFDRPHTDRNR